MLVVKLSKPWQNRRCSIVGWFRWASPQIPKWCLSSG